MSSTKKKQFVGEIAGVRVGTPVDPPPPLHLSQKERMEQGYAYVPADPELVAGRAAAHTTCRAFNDTPQEDGTGRREILKNLLHPDCKDRSIYMEPPIRIDYGYNVRVGNNFYSNWDCVFLDSCLIDIGDDVLFAPGVHLYTATHPLDPIPRKGCVSGLVDEKSSQGIPGTGQYYELAAPIKIGNGCWIGGRSVICPGVEIGDNVVVGAGSVVAKNVPSNTVVAGNPAKIIRYLDGAELPPHLQGKK